jgi:CobQ-like glutamine amidotransferase family enzyme
MGLKTIQELPTCLMTKSHSERVVYGGGNNPDDDTEGLIYKNTFGTYFHGPILSRNARLAYRLVTTALYQKYGEEIQLPPFEADSSRRRKRTTNR